MDVCAVFDVKSHLGDVGVEWISKMEWHVLVEVFVEDKIADDGQKVQANVW